MTPSRIAVTWSALPAESVLEPLWLDLERRANGSFFQSWSWIGTWLNCLPDGVRVELLQAKRSSIVVGLGILVRRVVWRHGVVRSRGLFLSSAGDPELDEITIEHNGFLAERGAEREVTRACIEYLLAAQPAWDELFIDGMRDPDALAGLSARGARVRERQHSVCHHVDLAALRASGKGYIPSLGRSTRDNVRRSIREFERLGPLALVKATNLDQARSFLARLRHFHQLRWERRGKPGSFANAFFARFQDRLLESALATGAAQLLRLSAGAAELGYIYNFAYRGNVHYYLSGFDYAERSRHDRPGMVGHVMAIEHNLREGHLVYDFMAGDDDFKRRLSNATRTLAWTVVQRPRLMLRFEDALRRWRGS